MTKRLETIGCLTVCVVAMFYTSGQQSVAYASPTFTKDVAPILHDKCATCHRPGEIAPMSLLTYEDARPWAKSIKKYVANGEMPPWKADPRYGKFSNDISLAQEEIDSIVDWVDAGAPRGAKSDMPEVPVFDGGWQLGEPDYIIDLPSVDILAEGPDTFPNLDVVLDLPEDSWVRAVEVHPGNRKVLHHMVSFLGGGASSATSIPDFLTVWAVGTQPAVYPEGTGRMISKDAKLRMNMHYHTYGEAATDQTRIGLYFGDDNIKKAINGQFAGTVNFRIPANDDNYRVDAHYLVDEDIQITSFFPHMHTRGKSMKYTATYPDGRQEILLDVPQYDFNWQWFYYPETPVTLPEGTVIDIEAHYDNSANNPNNPDPTIDVTFGEESYSEMMFGAFEFIPVEGMHPRPIDITKKLDKLFALYDAESTYKVNADLGSIKMLSGFVLPRDGDGAWFFPFGRSLLEIPILNIEWNNEMFHADMPLLGHDGITINGTVDGNGTILGTFDMGDYDINAIGGGMIQPKGFAGERVENGIASANTD